MAALYFCILPSDWPKWNYSSIQVQLYDDQPINLPGIANIAAQNTSMIGTHW